MKTILIDSQKKIKEKIKMANDVNVSSSTGDKDIKVQDSNTITSPDFGSDNLDLFNQAMSAVKAGIAYTAKRYSEIDDPSTAKNPEKGTFAYDNDKSIHFVS